MTNARSGSDVADRVAARLKGATDSGRLEEELRGFRGRSLAMMVRVLGCTTLKRALEALCVKRCSAATADWLLKDAAKSAKRKALRCVFIDLMR